METVSLPRESTLPSPHRGLEPLRILIIDDDKTDRILVRGCLQRSGLSVAADEASSGKEALQLIKISSYDCIILDYYLPDIDGFAIFNSLHTATPDCPVIMLTGVGDEDLAVELMKAGAADYLPKASMTPERLQAGVRYTMELARARKARTEAEEKLRSQEALFRTLANSIPQLAWMSDTSGSRNWFNERWFEYTGRTADQLRGWGWHGVVHPDYAERIVELIRESCATGEPWESIHPLGRKDGTYRWFLVRALPVRTPDGEIAGWLGTNTDITEQKNAESERERLLALEHGARTRAERATRSRDEFLAIVSHDMRNLIQIVLSAARRLPPSPADEKGINYVEFVQRSAHEMDRLVRDLLDLSSMETGQFRIERKPVDLGRLFEDARERFNLAAHGRSIAFDCEVDPSLGPVNADCDRLLQVITNLIGNALKFTPDGGHVSLRAFQRGGCAEIMVQDTGAGIAPEQLPHIFDRFRWKGRASRDSAGLGLAICKGIVDAHGGRIEVESTQGAGTTFRASIPLA